MFAFFYYSEGKSLIHPNQIATCNSLFSPSKAEVAHAQAVISAWDLAMKEGLLLFLIREILLPNNSLSLRDCVLRKICRYA